jgi:hypothetical protein
MVKYELSDQSNTLLKLKVRANVLSRLPFKGYTSILEAWNYWHSKIQTIDTKMHLKAEQIFTAHRRDDRSFDILWMKKPWAVVFVVPDAKAERVNPYGVIKEKEAGND